MKKPNSINASIYADKLVATSELMDTFGADSQKTDENCPPYANHIKAAIDSKVSYINAAAEKFATSMDLT